MQSEQEVQEVIALLKRVGIPEEHARRAYAQFKFAVENGLLKQNADGTVSAEDVKALWPK